MFLYRNFLQRQLACDELHRHHPVAELGGRLSSNRIDIVVGTRPEAIKLEPVAAALTRRGLPPRLIFTGQHPLDAAGHGLAPFQRVVLDCPGGGDPGRHADQVAQQLAPLLNERTDLLIVQGDTSSAFGGCLAGEAAGVAVAHVEAGLRSFDPAMPWPEEEFRTGIDARAALLFAPTEISAANLEAEAVPGAIFVTGNTGIDALLAIAQPCVRTARPREELKLLVTCHRRESWGEGLQSIAEALIQLSGRHPLSIELVLHPNPTVAGKMRSLLAEWPGISLLEPMPHARMVAAMQQADILLSDSGGMQEEAPALGIPLLVLREKTERPEGVASGNMLLVGTRRSKIVEGVERLLDPGTRMAMSRPSLPFGDGHSADRIAGHIADYLRTTDTGLARILRA